MKLSLSSEDISHLYLFKSYLKSNHIVKEYKIKIGFKTNNKESRLLICNKYFGKNLYENYKTYNYHSTEVHNVYIQIFSAIKCILMYNINIYYYKLLFTLNIYYIIR